MSTLTTIDSPPSVDDRNPWKNAWSKKKMDEAVTRQTALWAKEVDRVDDLFKEC